MLGADARADPRVDRPAEKGPDRFIFTALRDKDFDGVTANIYDGD